MKIAFIMHEINRSFLSTSPHFESEGFWKIKNGLIIVDYFCLGHDKKKACYTLPTVIIV